MGAFAARTFFQTLAKIGQFVLPLVFLGGAAASFFAKRKRTQLVEAVATSDAPDILEGMTWREFESLVEEAFRLRGYTVKRIGGDGPDGGVDLELKRDAETVLVQCKQWRAHKVGVQVVRELYGVMAARGAASGIVVTSGTFTQDAIDFASGRNVQLMAGDELRELVRAARNAKPSPVPATPASAPTSGCPVCGGPMVKRQAKRGANAGGYFYGCSRYPACKGTRAA
jgi:restriction system protein